MRNDFPSPACGGVWVGVVSPRRASCPHPNPRPRAGEGIGACYLMASITAWLHAPVGARVITGLSPPAESSVCTVRS